MPPAKEAESTSAFDTSLAGLCGTLIIGLVAELFLVEPLADVAFAVRPTSLPKPAAAPRFAVSVFGGAFPLSEDLASRIALPSRPAVVRDSPNRRVVPS